MIQEYAKQDLEKRYATLIEMVRRMRGYQRAYHMYHAGEDLRTKKRYEKKVDSIIAEYVKNSKQQELF